MSASTAADAWLNRVEALLAKAESTEYPDEAEALLAKAQELMARHAIDEAMLAAAGHHAGEVIVETIEIRAPYASAKASLLGAVAAVNTCRVVMSSAGRGDRLCQIVGHREDLDATTTLYAALVLQATRSMLAADVPFGDTPRRFRHSFLIAFAGRIGERLRAAHRDAVDEARRSEGGSGVDIVLADRATEVDRAFRTAFPHTRNARASSSSLAGHRSGRRAANSAALGRRGLPNRRRGLGSG